MYLLSSANGERGTRAFYPTGDRPIRDVPWFSVVLHRRSAARSGVFPS